MTRRNLRFLSAAALLVIASPGGAAAADAPPAQGWAEVNGTSLRYRIEGPTGRPVIVLVHEMGTSLEGWDEVAPRLARRYRVLRYDVRGFGLSAKLRVPVTFADESGDLAALLDRLAITTPVTVVGSALGGAIALDFAARLPDRTAGVVAIGPAAYPDPRPAAVLAADRIESGGVPAMIRPAVDMIYPPALRTPERFRRFLGIQLATDPTSLAITTRMVGGAGFRDILPRIRCRTWIAATTLFNGRDPDQLRALAALVPDGRFETLATGHLAAIESPEETAALVERFMTSRLPPRRP